MFEKLQKKWKVSGTQLFLVLCVFALGGSATGWLGKQVMDALSIDRGWLWTLIYVIVITFIWPIAVLIMSIPFGQFSFFKQYLRKIGSRMGILGRSGARSPELRVSPAPRKNAKKIAVFASGAGSNAKKILDYFGTEHDSHDKNAVVGLIACNKAGAGVLGFAKDLGVPVLMIEKEPFFRGDGYVDELKAAGIEFIVLAGFLWKIPQTLINAYRNRIVNIHPALLPKYGGKGMYGVRVHEAVIAAGEQESGITIHYVDEHYDNGDTIFQATVPVTEKETPESLANKIHVLEHQHYPRVIEELIGQPNGR